MNETSYQSVQAASAGVSPLLLERYVLGELDSGEREKVEALLSADPDVAARIEGLRLQDREIRAAYPPEKVFPGGAEFFSDSPAGFRFFSGRRARSAFRFRVFPGAAGALALCAAAALLVFSLPLLRERFAGQDQGVFTDRIKGGAELRVYLKSDQTLFADDTVLGEGSTVQLAYTSGESRYGVIFSIDGRQAVTLHYPYRPDGSTELIQGKHTALEEAYTLDDAPLCEIFFFVSSASPVDVASVLDKAKILARDPRTALERGTGIFSGYILKTVYVGKE